MNRGLKAYYIESYKKSKVILKNKDSFFKYSIYLIASFLAIILIIPRLIFSLSNVRIIRNANYEGKIGVSKSFESASDFKSLKTLILTRVISITFGFALIFVCLLLVLLLNGFYEVINYITNSDSIILLVFLNIPGAVLLIGALGVYKYYLKPISYIIDTQKGVNASNTLYISFYSMRRNGKFSLFLIDLISFLINCIYFLACGLIIYGLISLDSTASIVIALILTIGFVILYLIINPFIKLTKGLMVDSLLNDIVLDKFNLSKKTKGIDISKFNEVPIKKITCENTLAKAFDLTKNKHDVVFEEIKDNDNIEIKDVDKVLDDNIGEMIDEVESVDEMINETEAIDDINNEVETANEGFDNVNDNSDFIKDEFTSEDNIEVEDYVVDEFTTNNEFIDDSINEEMIDEIVEKEDVVTNIEEDVLSETTDEENTAFDINDEINNEINENIEIKADEVVENDINQYEKINANTNDTVDASKKDDEDTWEKEYIDEMLKNLEDIE